MAKGKLANPQIINLICQYCENSFEFHRVASPIRKACYECLPDEKLQDAALLRRLVKTKAVKEKGNCCYYCKNSFPQSVYDFHHLDPNEKDFGLGQKQSTIKWEIVKTEIDKCVMLCASCHRMVHSGDIFLK